MLFRRGPKVPPPRPPDLPFDEAARDALGAATEQAQAANASAIHAEHLLFALLADPRGLAARALRRLNVEPDDVRRHIEHAAPPRPWGVRAPVLPFADDTKGAIEFAMREARVAGVREVGAGQLLLGVVQSPRGVPVRILPPLGLTPDALRSALHAESRPTLPDTPPE